MTISENADDGTATVRICMLGQFKIFVGDQMIDDNISRSHKMWALLAYLIIHRQRSIPQEELISTLWPEEDNGNPANALKTLLYRTRASLVPLLGEDCQLILSQRGSYSWNHNLTCTVDAEEFDQLVTKAADRQLSSQIRKELYAQAMELYQHDFLPKLSDQIWAISFTTYYHYLYLDSVFSYGALLLQDEEYTKIIDLCNQAIQIEPCEEKLYVLLIKALLAQDNVAAALSHYKAASDILYRVLGLRPSEELQNLYQEIMKEQKEQETDLSVIQQDLREAIDAPGPFFCEYAFFRQVYRLEARRARRSGGIIQIALITLSLPDGSSPTPALVNKTMDQLQQVMQSCLRSGDVVARYSSSQYVLMLPSASSEDSVMVIGRIINAFKQKNRKRFLILNYKIQQMDLDKIKVYRKQKC